MLTLKFRETMFRFRHATIFRALKKTRQMEAVDKNHNKARPINHNGVIIKCKTVLLIVREHTFSQNICKVQRG